MSRIGAERGTTPVCPAARPWDATPAPPASPSIHRYNSLAPRYDRLHSRWLRTAGGEAQAALEAAVRTAMRPGLRLLDAGCGTGQFVRNLIAEGIEASSITIADPAHAMLTRCSDLPVERVVARLENLPFPDEVFDVVTCAWALETAADTEAAIGELSRVVRPGGLICLAYCAAVPAGSIPAWVMRRAVWCRGTGTFLNRHTVEAALTDHAVTVWRVPCRGPVSALIGRKLLRGPASSGGSASVA